jgi:hypothetical protein
VVSWLSAMADSAGLEGNKRCGGWCRVGLEGVVSRRCMVCPGGVVCM